MLLGVFLKTTDFPPCPQLRYASKRCREKKKKRSFVARRKDMRCLQRIKSLSVAKALLYLIRFELYLFISECVGIAYLLKFYLATLVPKKLKLFLYVV